MCGIAGFVDFNQQQSMQTLQSMTAVLHHRGPDDSGYFFQNIDQAHIALGHRRLSILDLSSHGHQPMQFQHLHIVYNGEVYNYREIRNHLITHGYQFHSDSDTEVILKAFHLWGINAIKHFNGMFAIALYDSTKETLTLIRDRTGIKPLYWYYKDGNFLFASELKSFHQYTKFNKTINTQALALYLQYQFIPQPHTIFQNTYKLEAGYYLCLNLQTKQTQIEKYWDILNAYQRPKISINFEDAITEGERILQSACEYRMVADVPVGVFLSGGYDSSIVAALLQKERTQKLKTFTIGFHERGFDESRYAQKVAEYLGTDHTNYYCTPKEALEVIDQLPEIYDEPFADSSAIPTLLVSKLAREQVTVALSADGGDELFAGYTTYMTTQRWYNLLPRSLAHTFGYMMQKINPKLLSFLIQSYNFETRYYKISQIFRSKDIAQAMMYTGAYMTLPEVEQLVHPKIQLPKTAFDSYLSFSDNICDLDRMLVTDYKTYLVDDVLTKVDRATMSVSLEGREPLLDYRLAEFAASLPSKFKYHNNIQKLLLKEITHKYLPKSIMERPKMGFNVPLYTWFQNELKEYFMHYLDPNRIEKAGIFNSSYINRMLKRYLDGKQENVEKLWTLLMFEMWYSRWIEGS